MKYRTKESTIINVKKFFSNNPTEDKITLEEAFIAWGRNLDNKEANMVWFYNKLTHLKYHNLVKPIYAVRNSRRVLDKIQLTLEGKKALGRIEGDEKSDEVLNGKANKMPSSNLDTHNLVAEWTKKHPEFEVTFHVKLKESI